MGRFLEERGGSRLLDDPLMLQATAEIDTQDEEGRPKPRMQVAREIKAKERARDLLAQRYATSQLSQEQILHCLYSIGDNNNYLRFNRDPIDRCGGEGPRDRAKQRPPGERTKVPATSCGVYKRSK